MVVRGNELPCPEPGQALFRVCLVSEGMSPADAFISVELLHHRPQILAEDSPEDFLMQINQGEEHEVILLKAGRSAD
jgi:hypothetical protein